MLNYLLDEAQRILVPLALAAFTGFIAYLFSVVRTWLGIVESDSNEGEIRRAAETEAGILVKQDQINNPEMVAAAATKIVADLHHVVTMENYDTNDIKDMILGAAGMILKQVK